MEELNRKVIVSVDGSKDALKSLDYLDFMFGPNHDLTTVLFYVLPYVPVLSTPEERRDKQILSSLAIAEKKGIHLAERILKEAKRYLLDKGFEESRIQTDYARRGSGVAKDTCTIAKEGLIDAVIIAKQGKTDLSDFFMGELPSQLLDYCLASPVWIVGGDVRAGRTLLCIDPSENSIRAVDHAGFMLAGTDRRITLFHAMRHLTRFIPDEVVEEVPDLERLWRMKEGEEIAPYMERARKMLLDAGLKEEQIAVRVVEGSRSPANDILREAREGEYGTIVLGKKGRSRLKEFMFGSVTNRVIKNCAGFACWVVQ